MPAAELVYASALPGDLKQAGLEGVQSCWSALPASIRSRIEQLEAGPQTVTVSGHRPGNFPPVQMAA